MISSWFCVIEGSMCNKKRKMINGYEGAEEVPVCRLLKNAQMQGARILRSEAYSEVRRNDEG
ncbi:MAG: hypothetical protein C4576_24965 [Desulfobacteraceae bacterium]|nr:MAG: hypothetical protein C4576_24965 [Desulfobacteraceae bacterium]